MSKRADEGMCCVCLSLHSFKSVSLCTTLSLVGEVVVVVIVVVVKLRLNQHTTPVLGRKAVFFLFFELKLSSVYLYVVCCFVTWLVFLDIPQVCSWLDVEVVLCCVLWFTKAGRVTTLSCGCCKAFCRSACFFFSSSL